MNENSICEEMDIQILTKEVEVERSKAQGHNLFPWNKLKLDLQKSLQI